VSSLRVFHCSGVLDRDRLLVTAMLLYWSGFSEEQASGPFDHPVQQLSGCFVG
jgi:hypothetical protein